MIYRTARLTEQTCGDPACTAEHYEHGAFNTLHVEPLRQHRVTSFGSDKMRVAEVEPIPHEIDGNTVSFPGRQMQPVPLRQGRLASSCAVTAAVSDKLRSATGAAARGASA
jgi:hypothetical protein